MSRRRCASTSVHLSSTPSCRAPYASRRRQVTASRSRTTTAAHAALRRTGRWRWSLSSAPRRGLGRGFEVLIGGATPELAHLAVDDIHANAKQPRKRFDGEAVSGLAESI